MSDDVRSLHKKLRYIGSIVELSKEDIFKILASYVFDFDEMESLFLCKDDLIPLSMFLKDIDFNDGEYMNSKINTIHDCYIYVRKELKDRK